MKDLTAQKNMDAFIAGLGDRVPTLLLHSCCGPCSSYVLEYLSEYFDITLFFYNPNIQPAEEYKKRFDTQKQLLDTAKYTHPVKFAEGRDLKEKGKAVNGVKSALK